MNLRFFMAVVLVTFTAATARAADRRPPTITHTPVKTATVGVSIVIKAQIEDRSGIFAAAVYVRAAGATKYVPIQMKKTPSGFEAVIPAQRVIGDLEYFVEAFDTLGNGPARRASPDAPYTVRTARPTQRQVGLPGPVTAPPDEGGRADLLLSDREQHREQDSDEDDSIFDRWWFWTLVGVVAAGSIATTAVLTAGSDSPSGVRIQVVAPDPTRGLP